MRVLGAVRRFYNPMLFQGSLRAKSYFEGWYFKHVSGDRRWSCAFIPGVALSGKNPHSFVQFIDGSTGASRYFSYPLADFSADRTEFSLSVGPNRFSFEGIESHLSEADGQIEARLAYSDITPLDSGLTSPGIMGPYSFAPFMECYHGVGSLTHRVSGEVRIGGSRIDFDGGTGYLEKDWGRSMPSAWVWAHSNSFEQPKASFVFSLARVPWLGGWFPGFFCVLAAGGVQRRFATYTGASVSRFFLSGRQLEVDIRDRRSLLSLRAHRSREGVLRAPVQGVMDRRIGESLDARLFIRLTANDGTVLFDGVGESAGLEVVGEVSTLAPGPSADGRPMPERPRR